MASRQAPFVFGGFDRTNLATLPVPSYFLDVVMAGLTGAEVKVMLLLYERVATCGTPAIDISMAEISDGTGLSTGTARTAIWKLEARRLLERWTVSPKTKTFSVNRYRPRMFNDTEGWE